jgi:hypothetical protein
MGKKRLLGAFYFPMVDWPCLKSLTSRSVGEVEKWSVGHEQGWALK